MATMNYPHAAINSIDDLVKEYLLFRGFTQCIRMFDTEKKNDKLKGYQVCKGFPFLFFLLTFIVLSSFLPLYISIFSLYVSPSLCSLLLYVLCSTHSSSSLYLFLLFLSSLPYYISCLPPSFYISLLIIALIYQKKLILMIGR